MRLESRFRWLPTPFRSALLFVVWLLLNNSVSAGHIVLAVIFAILIPLVSFPFREPQPLIIKPGLALKQLIIVMYDIITANMQVSLTPGTVSAEVYPIPESLAEGEQPTQRYLLIHVLDLDDEQALIDTIKQRYEAPLKEIFQC